MMIGGETNNTKNQKMFLRSANFHSFIQFIPAPHSAFNTNVNTPKHPPNSIVVIFYRVEDDRMEDRKMGGGGGDHHHHHHHQSNSPSVPFRVMCKERKNMLLHIFFLNSPWLETYEKRNKKFF
jgi:hypothetical protein